MKWINYQLLSAIVDTGTAESPVMEEVLLAKSLTYSEENLEIAKREAYNSEYTIEDDGLEEISKPTWQDRIEAQVTYNSMMLGTLIEEV